LQPQRSTKRFSKAACEIPEAQGRSSADPLADAVPHAVGADRNTARVVAQNRPSPAATLGRLIDFASSDNNRR
jgi:hypothetical protein